MSSKWIKILILISVIVAIILTPRIFPVQSWLQSFAHWVQGAGWMGLFAFFLVYVLATALGLPATPLTLAAGMIYGPLWGTLLVSPSSVAGATLAFALGRTLMRGWVQRRLRGNPRLAALDEAVGQEGWRLVAMLRLSPLFPFSLMNYALGGTRIGTLSYVLASWIAMLPATFLYVSLGAAAGSALGIGGKVPLNPWLLGIGMLATLAVTLRVAYLAKRVLAQTFKMEKQA